MPTRIVGRFPDWPTLGLDVAEWVERYLCHGPGDVQGTPFVFDDEEIDLLEDLYRLYPPKHPRAGRRVVSRALYSRAKGRRKSELAGALVCVEAFGPARFGRWDGARPVPRRVVAPFIRCLATEEGQSGNTYDNVRVMLEHAVERFPDRFAGVDVGLTRIFLPGNGEIRPSTSSGAAKDGGKETFAVADEEHLYVLPELRNMHRTVSRNLVKRKEAEPWLLGTSTMFRPGQNSVAESAHLYAEQIDEGLVKNVGFYLNHREGTKVRRWRDDRQILRSLREAYGPAAEWMDLERIISAEIRHPDAEEAESRRYFLNQAAQSAEDAFDAKQWDGLARKAATIPDGAFVTVGFDGARFHDATGIVVTEISTGLQIVAGVWEQPPDTDGEWEVPEPEVDAALDDVFSRFEVWRLYADPPYWESAVDDWSGRYGDKRVIKWHTHRTRAMAFAVQAYSTAVRTGAVTHDGDPDLGRHIRNARRRQTNVKDDQGRFLWTVQKERPKSPKKIDLAVCAILSWEARRDAIAAGATPPRRRSRKVHSF